MSDDDESPSKYQVGGVLARTLVKGDRIQTFPEGSPVRVELLSGPEPAPAELFAAPGFVRFWARREDTLAEGWMTFGPASYAWRLGELTYPTDEMVIAARDVMFPGVASEANARPGGRMFELWREGILAALNADPTRNKEDEQCLEDE